MARRARATEADAPPERVAYRVDELEAERNAKQAYEAALAKVKRIDPECWEASGRDRLDTARITVKLAGWEALCFGA